MRQRTVGSYVCVVTVTEVTPVAGVSTDVVVHLKGSGIDVSLRTEAAFAPSVGDEWMCTLDDAEAP